jgi:integrase/recombinase XerD
MSDGAIPQSVVDHSLPRVANRGNDQPLTEWRADFLLDCEARRLARKTILIYHNTLAAFARWLPADSLVAVTTQHLRAYLVHLQTTHNPGGVHQAFRVLKTFCRWLCAEDVLAANPMARIHAPKLPDNPLPPLSLDDLAAMLKTCDRRFTGQRDRAILLALLDTGCRASEFVALNVADVNMADGSVIVQHGKGDKRRVVFLGACTRREMGRYLRGHSNSDALWVTRDGERLTYWGLRQIVRRRAEYAGVPEPGLHAFRRAFCLACLRNGMDLVSLQRLMGHADLSLLRRYADQTTDDLATAHQRASPVDNWR